MAIHTRLYDINRSSNRESVKESLFFRPRLSMEYNVKTYPSIYSPDRTYPIVGISRRYLRMYVKNAKLASKVAENCNASLIVIPLNSGIQYPANEYVKLAWEGSVNEVNVKTKTSRHIQPGEKGLLHLIFSDSTFPSVQVNPPSPIYAVVSSKDALDVFHPRIIEHGFLIGSFIVEVSITSDNSRPCKCYFKVDVGDQWNNLTMSKLSWFHGQIIRLRSWWHFR